MGPAISALITIHTFLLDYFFRESHGQGGFDLARVVKNKLFLKDQINLILNLDYLMVWGFFLKI